MSRMGQEVQSCEGFKSAAWQPAHNFFALAEDIIQVWRVQAVGAGPFYAACRALLSAEEVARLGRLRAGVAQDEFVIGRGCLRALLGAALKRAPRDIVFCTGANGKPSLAGIEFNLTHSKGLVLLALSRRTGVGIDVEWMDPTIEALEIARDTFAPDEFARLEASSAGAERTLAFYRCWVRKEAVVKAHGQGITLSLNNFDVKFDTTDEVRVEHLDEATGSERCFFVRGLCVGRDFSAALAATSAGLPLQLLDLKQGLLATDEQ